jgi:hypothetical protein
MEVSPESKEPEKSKESKGREDLDEHVILVEALPVVVGAGGAHYG